MILHVVLLWANLNNLPENIIPYVVNVIEDIKIGIQFDDGDFSNLKRRRFYVEI